MNSEHSGYCWPQTLEPIIGKSNRSVLEYHHDGAKHRYTPDILVAWGTYREVVEIKEDAEAELAGESEHGLR